MRADARQDNLTGGRRDIDHPTQCAPNQFSDSLNIELRGSRMGKSRRGSETKCSGGSGTIQGKGFFEKSPGNAFVLKVQNGILYYWANSGAAWKQIGATTFPNTDDKISIVTGFVSGVSGTAALFFEGTGVAVGYWDGDTSSNIQFFTTGATDPAQGNQAVVHPCGRLCVIGTTSRDTVSFSGLFDHGNGQWDSANLTKRIFTPAGESLLAICPYRNNELIVWTANSLHLMGNLDSSTVSTWTRETVPGAIGIKAPKTAVVTGEDAFFMSGDKHIRSLKRSSFDVAYGVTAPISYFNNDLIGTINSLHADGSTSVVFDNYLLIAFPKDDSPTNNRVLVFDLLKYIQLENGGIAPICIGEWSGWNVQDWIVATFNNQQRLFFVEVSTGDLIEALTGDSDDGDFPEFSITFRGMDWGNGDMEKILRFAVLKYEESFGTLTVEVLDDTLVWRAVDSITVNANAPVVGQAVVGDALGTPLTGQEPFYLFGYGRSRWWQLKITGTLGVWNFRELTMTADIVPARSGVYV